MHVRIHRWFGYDFDMALLSGVDLESVDWDTVDRWLVYDCICDLLAADHLDRGVRDNLVIAYFVWLASVVDPTTMHAPHWDIAGSYRIQIYPDTPGLRVRCLADEPSALYDLALRVEQAEFTGRARARDRYAMDVTGMVTADMVRARTIRYTGVAAFISALSQGCSAFGAAGAARAARDNGRRVL